MGGRADGFGDLAAGAEAAIEQATRREAVKGGLIVRQMLGLAPDRLLPGEAKPGQVLQDRRLIGRPATGGVDILDAQDEAAAGLAGGLVGGEGREGVPAVQMARGGGGEAGDEAVPADLGLSRDVRGPRSGCPGG